MISSRGNHGYVRKNDIFYTKQIILAEISEIFCCSNLLISQIHKNFSRPNSFWELCSQVPPLILALAKILKESKKSSGSSIHQKQDFELTFFFVGS